MTAEIADEKAKDEKAKEDKDGEKVKKSPAKKTKTVKKTVGLNSMLKNLAKPAEEVKPPSNGNNNGNAFVYLLYIH